jgi:hypothetical protein
MAGQQTRTKTQDTAYPQPCCEQLLTGGNGEHWVGTMAKRGAGDDGEMAMKGQGQGQEKGCQETSLTSLGP